MLISLVDFFNYQEPLFFDAVFHFCEKLVELVQVEIGDPIVAEHRVELDPELVILEIVLFLDNLSKLRFLFDVYKSLAAGIYTSNLSIELGKQVIQSATS